MLRRRIAAAISCGFLTLTLGLSGCGESPPKPQGTMQPFLKAWNVGDWPAMAALVDDPSPTFATTARALAGGLEATRSTHTLGPVTQKGSTATAQVTSTYQLPVLGAWTASTTIPLIKKSGHWMVQWSPTAVDSSLAVGDRLSLTYTWAPRANILGAGGITLTAQQAEVVVGLEGSRVKNASQVTSVLEAAGATSTEVTPALAAAKANPTYFEPVFTMSQVSYDQMGGNSSQLYQVPGTVFQNTSSRAATTPGLEAHLVGAVGPITAQELQTLGAPYNAASVIGQTGLEEAYQSQLAGTAGGTVTVISSAGHTVSTLATFAPKPGTAVQTSIDPGVQIAAESALAGVTGHVAMVAVNAATGQILASVSQPASDQFDQALEGQFPPGSTFKVLTSTALIEKGLSPSSPASCPASVTVDGEAFHNAEGDSPVSNMGQAFTESCNTAFVQLATANLQASSFPAVAAHYGVGTAPKMGLAAAAGSVPLPKDQAALAATAIGQASVILSPLNMALVAGTVDSGSFHPARLVTGAPDDTATPQALPAAVLTGLRQMMASVVAQGTAANTGLPAGTYAKTGTAQYGSGNPLPIDAWLMGYKGQVAFAIVEQNSKGNGGPVDGPIIAKFLKGLPANYS